MSFPKRDYPIWKRAAAGAIDLTIVFIALKLKFLPLSIAAYTYILLRDWINDGQSLGKNIMGLRTIHLDGRSPVSILQSTQRNIHFFIFALSWRIPYLPLIVCPTFIALLLFEFYSMYVVPWSPRVLGFWAKTTVIEDRYIEEN